MPFIDKAILRNGVKFLFLGTNSTARNNFLKQLQNPRIELQEIKSESKVESFIEDEERINRALTNMENAGINETTISAIKIKQRICFESEIKQNDWKLDELAKLLNYMIKVQNETTQAHPFNVIRTEQSLILKGGKWNTQSWQSLIYKLKQRLIHQLVISKQHANSAKVYPIVLSDAEYNKYHRLLAAHCARIFCFGRTNSIIDFAEKFISQSQKNEIKIKSYRRPKPGRGSVE